MKRKFPRFAASAIDDVEVDTLPWQTAGAAPQEAFEQLPEAGPSRPICDTVGPSTRKSHCLCQPGSDGCAKVVHVSLSKINPRESFWQSYSRVDECS